MLNVFILLFSISNVVYATSVQRPLCGENEIEVPCRTICIPQFCNISYTEFKCPENIPCEPGCDCKKDYLRDNRGVCVFNNDCPPPLQCNGPNEVKSDCKRVCPSQQCKDLDKAFACEPLPPCEPGCNCVDGFYRNKKGICVTDQECRDENCGLNEVYTDCKKTCPSETCSSIGGSFNCSSAPPCSPGCKCKNDYFRNAKGQCIPRSKCPNPGPRCGPNEYYELCPVKYPPKVCSSLWTRYPYKPDDGSCKPNCTCIDGYLRDGPNGKCVRVIDQCIHGCADNEIYVENSTQCQRTCENSYVTGPTSTCKPYYGCVCARGLVRTYANGTGPCIPEDQCYDYSQGSSEETSQGTSEETSPSTSEESCQEPQPPKCPVKKECRRTCAVPNPQNCEYTPEPKTNVDGCQCQSGYILSAPDGKCVKIQECSKYSDNCNGDKNATLRECPPPCPSTCEAPNQFPCKKMCLQYGCHCKTGYLRASVNGQCILPKDCKGGVNCPKNERFAPCKIGCLTNYCPKNAGRRFPICDPPKDCPSGCVCKFNHKRISQENPQCIPTIECPPLDCTTLPNEHNDPCPSPCLAEYCRDKDNQPSTCNTFAPVECRPTCVCNKDTFRNASNICVPRKYCPYEDISVTT